MNIVTLDVGGTKMRTLRATLGRYPESKLAEILSVPAQNDGSFFVDSDAKIFSHVLQGVRRGTITSSDSPIGIHPIEWESEVLFWKLGGGRDSEDKASPQELLQNISDNITDLTNAVERVADEVRDLTCYSSNLPAKYICEAIESIGSSIDDLQERTKKRKCAE